MPITASNDNSANTRRQIELLSDHEPTVKIKAADSLTTLSYKYPETQDTIREAGGIAPLVKLLSDENGDVRKYAAMALWHLAENDTNRDTIREVGGIALLVRLLSDEDGAVRENTAGALMDLIYKSSTNQDVVLETGGIALLVKLLGDDCAPVRKNAVGVLYNCSYNSTAQKTIIEAGGITPLVRLLTDEDDKVREAASGTLESIAFQNPDLHLDLLIREEKKKIPEESNNSPIVTFITPPSGKKEITQINEQLALLNDEYAEKREVSAKNLSKLVRKVKHDYHYLDVDRITSEITQTLISSIIKLLNNENPKLKANTAILIRDLVKDHKKNQNAMAKVGAILTLLSLLRDPEPAIQIAAINALHALGYKHKTNKASIATAALPLLQSPIAFVQINAVNVLCSTENLLCKSFVKRITPLLISLLENAVPKVQNHVEEWLKLLNFCPLYEWDEKSVDSVIVPGIVSLLKTPVYEVLHIVSRVLFSWTFSDGYGVEPIIKAGAVPLLLHLFQNTEDKVQKQISIVICKFCQQGKMKTVFAEAGAFPLFLKLLQSSEPQTQSLAADILCSLTRFLYPPHITSFVEAGAIPVLISLLRNHELQGRSVSMLFSLALETENLNAIVKSGAIPLIVNLLESLDPLTQGGSVALLECLTDKFHASHHKAANSTAIVKAGAIPLLMNLLKNQDDDGKEYSTDLIHDTVHTIFNLSENDSILVAIAEFGIIPLMKILQSSRDYTQKYTLDIFARLMENHEANRIVSMTVNAIPFLVSLLSSPAPTCTRATEVLGYFAKTEVNQNSIAESKAIPLLVDLLRSRYSMGRERAADTLAKLSYKHVGNQSAIAVVGAIPILASLLQAIDLEERKAARTLYSFLVEHEENRAVIDTTVQKIQDITAQSVELHDCGEGLIVAATARPAETTGAWAATEKALAEKFAGEIDLGAMVSALPNQIINDLKKYIDAIERVKPILSTPMKEHRSKMNDLLAKQLLSELEDNTPISKVFQNIEEKRNALHQRFFSNIPLLHFPIPAAINKIIAKANGLENPTKQLKAALQREKKKDDFGAEKTTAEETSGVRLD